MNDLSLDESNTSSSSAGAASLRWSLPADEFTLVLSLRDGDDLCENLQLSIRRRSERVKYCHFVRRNVDGSRPNRRIRSRGR